MDINDLATAKVIYSYPYIIKMEEIVIDKITYQLERLLSKAKNKRSFYGVDKEY